MSVRQLTLLGAAGSVIAGASPVMAQPEMTYEYAQPLPRGDVIYRQEPVVQPLPAPPQRQAAPPEAYNENDYPADYDYDYERETYYDDAPVQPPADYYAAPPSQPAHLDQDAWLTDCRARYRAHDERRDGGVAGGLIGAAAGGLIGNRVADGERLAGTLIGAGVGGLAGLAIGTAIGAATDENRAADHCEAWLERYQAGYAHAPAPRYPAPYGYGHLPGYYGPGCGCTPAVTYMPVLVAVPQRAVVREVVTEEGVEVEPQTRRVMHKPAPRPSKRIKYSKGK